MTTSTQRPRDGVWCIVVAAGSGRRFGAAKQYEQLDDGERVVDRAVRTAASVCDGVVLVLPLDELDVVVDHATVTVSGGATRSASVRAGLAAVPGDARVVLVHDAARPLASPQLFHRVIDAVRGGASAVVPVVPVTDTVRDVEAGVVDRDRLRAVQTPQGFDAAVLRAAHHDEPEGSDDAGLIEATGAQVVLVDGEPTNLKLTHAHDLQVARVLDQLAGSGPDTADSTT